MAKAYKNDIFEVIKQIDYKNYQYYDSLTEEQKKEIQPYTLTRWCSTASGNEENHEYMTLMINNFVNNHFWELSKYKDLQWKLLCSCGLKKFMRHQWIPMSKSNKDKDFIEIRKFYSHLTNQEFERKYNNMTKEEKLPIKQTLGLVTK